MGARDDGRVGTTGARASGGAEDREDAPPLPVHLEVTFGPTTSPALPGAIRAAEALPGYRTEGEGRHTRHMIATPLPFFDRALWRQLWALLMIVGRWTTTRVQIGGRPCGALWRDMGVLDQVLTCFHRRPAGPRSADYCAGRATPTSDATAWGCRFVRGVDLEAWGDDDAPWFHFGRLTDDHRRFIVDKAAITETLHAGTRDHVCQSCPAFSWPAAEAVVAALPETVTVSPAAGYAFRYSARDPATPVGVTVASREEDLTIAFPEDKEDDTIAPGTRSVPTVRYSDVAGQDAAVEAVRDVCELPLTHQAYFAALGLTAPRGVLLYGPPGNGKTLLAQAVATETAAHLELVSGPEILSRWVGGSEAQLRAVFARARAQAPAIILLDELDALAGPRDGPGRAPYQAALVAQLLVLLDGLEARCFCNQLFVSSP